jgi:hypothetical protein
VRLSVSKGPKRVRSGGYEGFRWRVFAVRVSRTAGNINSEVSRIQTTESIGTALISWPCDVIMGVHL